MTTLDLVSFGFGLVAGALALFVPWIRGPFKRYVVNCANASCPHHGEANRRRIKYINDDHRSGPPPARP